MIPNFVNWTWWVKWQETRVITEEGIFADSFVPDDYGGAQLTVKVTQVLFLVTANGHIRTMTIGDTIGVMDDQRKDGMGIYVFGLEAAGIEDQTYVGPGPSDNVVQWIPVENPTMADTFKNALYDLHKTALATLLDQ